MKPCGLINRYQVLTAICSTHLQVTESEQIHGKVVNNVQDYTALRCKKKTIFTVTVVCKDANCDNTAGTGCNRLVVRRSVQHFFICSLEGYRY
jgi:hypothetical protein